VNTIFSGGWALNAGIGENGQSLAKIWLSVGKDGDGLTIR